MDWFLVKDSRSGKAIGALAYLDGKIAVVAAFYHDKDANDDGKISVKERIGSLLFSMKGRQLARVASEAYADPDLLMRDPTLYNLRGRLLVDFATGLIAEGVYTVYFNQAVKKLAGAAAAGLTPSPIKQFVIRKGMQGAVKQAYRAATGI